MDETKAKVAGFEVAMLLNGKDLTVLERIAAINYAMRAEIGSLVRLYNIEQKSDEEVAAVMADSLGDIIDALKEAVG